jgi:hypothetical protein
MPKQKKTNCDIIATWTVNDYTIQKERCPDLVLAHYHKYQIIKNNQKVGKLATKQDSCVFNWQASKDRFIKFNVCNQSISEISERKYFLKQQQIDSILIFSRVKKQSKTLTLKQSEKFVSDYNKSESRGYSTESFDKAFDFYPAYQYRLTVYSKLGIQEFYGYNYIILNSDNWKYEMNTKGKLNYFDKYWSE